MDGFDTNASVVVLAATNRTEVLDKALTRPGRFDRNIHLNLPDLKSREEIFKIYLSKLKLQDKKDIVEYHAKRLATLSPNFSGADIENICNEAAIQAVREKHEFITR